MRASLASVFFTLAACGAPQPAASSSTRPSAGPEPGAVTGAASRVRADDGHEIAVWSKRVAKPSAVFVLVHGRTWSGRPDFDLQVEGEALSLMDLLVGKNYSAWAVDMRGYGRTSRDGSGWLEPGRAVADLAAVVEEVKRAETKVPIVLLGWSYGSMISQLYVQRHPEGVDAVVLYGYPRHPDSTASPSPEAGEPARKATTADGAREDFIVPDVISDAAVEAFVQQALEADPVRADWRRTEDWDELDPGRVPVPVLLIHGESDPYAPHEAMRAFVERLSVAHRHVAIPSADHAAHLEHPAAFVQHLASFVDSEVAAGSSQ